MKKTTLIGFTLLLFSILSCGVPQAEYDKLKKENENLKKDLADCELTPSQLFDQANSYYDEANYTRSRERFQKLIAKYANSNEGKQGRKLLKEVENKLLETARANRNKTEDKNEGKDDSSQAKEEIENTDTNNKAITKMKVKYDINDDVTWYSDPSSATTNTTSYIQTYIGQREKKPWMGLSINYFSKKKWLHLERIEITVDGETFEIEEESPGEFKAANISDGKREWIDRIVKKEDLRLTEKIAASKTAKIKYVGEDDVYTKTVSKTEKKAIKNVLDAFEALGGNTD
ncbi:hypothetical protein U6A24_15010 [Aquimarina gracilis]|uniref:Lipoprotein n=1 Tax=Aquimarina gracilis TaxID=874422 RepID=A0ABU5ZY90_9FLAO|nr:hypothetical protein [Aquimarina gracilis]MEB3346786.1 hypothetical protein [Aquimarina gracilis]